MILQALALIFMNVTLFGTEVPKAISLENEYTQEFVKGVATGAVAGLIIEFLRKHILPDITTWNLYSNYGICRDQLTGETKVVTALLAGEAFEKTRSSGTNVKKLGARLLGVITGACASSLATKIVTK